MSERDFSVRLNGVSKEFARGGARPTLFRILTGALGRPAFDGEGRKSLDAIDLTFPKGGLVGIIGHNGAGKTTLLKTIAGLYTPSAGRVETTGEIALLAGLGAGMVDELTVDDNIWLYGAVCGIRRATLVSAREEILGWAELEDFDEAELRTLSMGMRTRLAFSIAKHIDAETVLIDEAFSAGDRRFQDKCDRFFVERGKGGQTYLVATHNINFVRDFCAKTLWLSQGAVRAYGDTADVLREFEAVEAG